MSLDAVTRKVFESFSIEEKIILALSFKIRHQTSYFFQMHEYLTLYMAIIVVEWLNQ